MVEWLESLPLAVVFLGTALLIVVSCEAGFRCGNFRRKEQGKDAPTAIGPIVGGLLGMLGFLLAFTFSMAASQHAARKTNVLEEANAIGTAYLRADLLESQYQENVKRLLREYVDARLETSTKTDPTAAIQRAVEIHGQLWGQVSTAASAKADTNTALVVQSINDVIDMHERRVTGSLHNRIPGSVWLALIAITVFTMVTMGLQFGFSGRRRHLPAVFLALAFASLVTLVVDLNRPARGLITVGQDSLLDLQQSMDQDVQ